MLEIFTKKCFVVDSKVHQASLRHGCLAVLYLLELFEYNACWTRDVSRGTVGYQTLLNGCMMVVNAGKVPMLAQRWHNAVSQPYTTPTPSHG